MAYRRQKIMKAPAKRGIVVIREGSRHTIVGRPGGRGEPVPRHSEINRLTMRRIAKNLGIDWDNFVAEIR
jgi:hypothetical protein